MEVGEVVILVVEVVAVGVIMVGVVVAVGVTLVGVVVILAAVGAAVGVTLAAVVVAEGVTLVAEVVDGVVAGTLVEDVAVEVGVVAVAEALWSHRLLLLPYPPPVLCLLSQLVSA